MKKRKIKKHAKENYIRHKHIEVKENTNNYMQPYLHTNKQTHQDSSTNTLIKQHKPTIKILHAWTNIDKKGGNQIKVIRARTSMCMMHTYT